jgi:molybdate transport system substrate-binding protein
MKRSFLLVVLATAVASATGISLFMHSQKQREGSVRRVLRVAAAADLQFAFQDLHAAFEKEHRDIEVVASFGSSGNFYAQLENRAPFDIFFSADLEYPRRLIDKGLARRESLFQYAIGHLVLWVPNSSTIDVEKLKGDAVLASSVHQIAIANPKYAPYGRAAEAALKSLSLYERVKDRLVLGDNVGQTAQFVDSGAAEIGLIALSLAVAPNMRDRGRYWEVPLDGYPPLEQGGVIMNWAEDELAAEALRAFVLGSEGRAILRRYGFHPPGE